MRVDTFAAFASIGYAPLMADDSPSRSLDRIMIRLPEGMRERLHARADIENKSTNAFIVDTLMQALDATEQQWREASQQEMMRLLEEEGVYEDRVADLRVRRLRILRRWAEREGDEETMAEIDRHIDDLDRVSDPSDSPIVPANTFLYPIDWSALSKVIRSRR